ncbi:MAG: hypothetical protein ACFE68_05445 [Candidatus Hodarchaeota archaeon]
MSFSKMISNWKKEPFEARIMDLVVIANFLIFIIAIFAFQLMGIKNNVRNFPAIWLPLFLLIITFGLRIKLRENPKMYKPIFLEWLIAAIFGISLALLVALYYPL